MPMKQTDETDLPRFEDRVRTLLAEKRSGLWGYYAHRGLDDFHWSRLATMCSKSSPPIWSCEDENGPALLFGLQDNVFHTQVFKTPVCRVSPFYLLRPEPETAAACLKELCLKVEAADFGLASLRISTLDHVDNFVLSSSGWSHVGCSVKLGLNRDTWAKRCVDKGISTDYSKVLSDTDDSVLLREADNSDTAVLGNLIRQTHRHSHFFNDPYLKRDARDSLFPQWIARSVQGRMDLVLVAEEQGTPIGFASSILSRGLAPFIGHEVGVLDFVAVHPSAQGRGVGTRLLNAAFAWLFEWVPFLELRTMVDNIGALSLYTKLGLVILTSDHHYHYRPRERTAPT